MPTGSSSTSGASSAPATPPVPEAPKIAGFVKLAEGKGGVLVGGPHGEAVWLLAEDAKGYDLAEAGSGTAPDPGDGSAVMWEGERAQSYVTDPDGEKSILALRHSRFGWVVVAEGK